MNTKIKEHGFALWELLIIIVVLLVVGGIGAYVWNKKNEQKTTTVSSKTVTAKPDTKEPRQNQIQRNLARQLLTSPLKNGA